MATAKENDKVREKRAMEAEILAHRKKTGMHWEDYFKQYKLLESDKWSFYRVGRSDSTFKSVQRLHNAIFGKSTQVAVELSDESVGVYIRSDYQKYEGTYALIRPSIHENYVIYGYPAELKWDKARKAHRMRLESPNSILEYGSVFFIGHLNTIAVHFSETYHHSLMLLRPGVLDRNLYGCVSSVMPISTEKDFAPASVPMVLVREEEHIPLQGGYINRNHALYDKCLKLIGSVTPREAVFAGWWNEK